NALASLRLMESRRRLPTITAIVYMRSLLVYIGLSHYMSDREDRARRHFLETGGTLVKSRNANLPSDCRAVSEILSRVGDKWSVLVVKLLGDGSMRFNELRHR